MSWPLWLYKKLHSTSSHPLETTIFWMNFLLFVFNSLTLNLSDSCFLFWCSVQPEVKMGTAHTNETPLPAVWQGNQTLHRTLFLLKSTLQAWECGTSKKKKPLLQVKWGKSSSYWTSGWFICTLQFVLIAKLWRCGVGNKGKMVQLGKWPFHN